jgi:transposase
MQTKVLIGVDPHKATNALAALDEHGELLERRQFPADRKGLEALERWAANFPRRKWAVEGANGLWAGLWPTGWPPPARMWWMSHPSSRRV